MSSLRSELRVEDGPNGATSKDTRFMHVLKQPHRTTSPQRRAFFVLIRRYCGGPAHRALSALGAVTGSGVFWVAEMKRDPHAPFDSAVDALLFELLLGQDTSRFLSCRLFEGDPGEAASSFAIGWWCGCPVGSQWRPCSNGSSSGPHR
jgi:hypothetical protein